MSRVAKIPVILPQNVEVTLLDRSLLIKGPKGNLVRTTNPLVQYEIKEQCVQISALQPTRKSKMQSGTAQRLLSNDVVGVVSEHKITLSLVGVGYSARFDGANRQLILNLGFSHPIHYALPEGVNGSCPSSTEILIQGIDKQIVTQVAADIRALRPPEPYKGKGVRYAHEKVLLKEAKKK